MWTMKFTVIIFVILITLYGISGIVIEPACEKPCLNFCGISLDMLETNSLETDAELKDGTCVCTCEYQRKGQD